MTIDAFPRTRRRRARPTGSRLPVKSSALLAALLFSMDGLDGMTSVVSAASPLLRGLEAPLDDNWERILAEGGDAEGGSTYCHNSASFLGVGNTQCLHENLRTAVFLLAVIVAVSIGVDRLIHYIRTAIKCPQLRKIVNRIFEEVMILGFLSMVIFTLNTSGAMKSLALNNLTASEQLHFYEFFHYVVFLTMIYFIVIVLLLLFIGTVVPKLVWEIKKHPDERRESISDIHDDTYDPRFPSIAGSTSDRDDCGSSRRMRHSFIRDASSLARDLNPHSSGSSFMDDGERTLDTPSDDYYVAMRARQRSDGDGVYRTMAMRTRALSGMDLVLGSRAYSLLLQRYQREGCGFRFNIRKQWNLWKSFEILAYNICQNRSGYIYKNPFEMERLFGVRPTSPARPWVSSENGGAHEEDGVEHEDDENRMSYAKYHVLCMRNLLFHMTNIHPSAFLILLVICLLPSIFPEQDHWIFIGVGGLLLLVNVVIFFKVLKILRGIVDDRLRIITMRDIQTRLDKHQLRNLPRKTRIPLAMTSKVS
ncbi:DNA/RNA-binding protein [Phytophthora cinnamomi]|uniref:DNA/RNA-binding protein n=1 Tax=Phytophthora cinnamomi TaxID=4785 RepID=UPI003559C70A|nr:DNA/RNA-binding protein [Phytophthora cinnamomi]